MSAKFTFPVKSFRKLDEPHANISPRAKYRFYVEVKNVPEDLLEWMETNPREQNLETDVAKEIKKSLKSKNKSFHLWNRGIFLSVDDVKYDNKDSMATIIMTDRKIHGDIDGGHTLKIIVNNNNQISKNEYHEQYVEFEVITGIDSTINLAEARNTSTPVDTASIEELKQTFDDIKEIIIRDQINGEEYANRIAYKQNQFKNSNIKNIIDIREFIAIINMFNPLLYAKDDHPIQSYTGKEVSLRKFLNMSLAKDATDDEKGRKRKDEINKMSILIPQIVKLWDTIECTFTDKAKSIKKRYGRKAYSKYKTDENDQPVIIDNALFSSDNLYYSIPRGIMYPIVGAFRALIKIDDSTKKYVWMIDPFFVWDELGDKLVEIILNSSNEQNDNPNAIGKSLSTWGSLFDKIYIFSLERLSK